MKDKHEQYIDNASGGLRQYLYDNSPFAGRVVDDRDPERRGRVRIRVPVLHGDERAIPDDLLPWADNPKSAGGSSYSSPEIGKVVHVEFPLGDLYHPRLRNSEHYDPSLQQKLDDYQGSQGESAYRSFKAVLFNSATQIWSDRKMGLVMDYNMSQINIDKDRNIHLELQAPDTKLNLVHRDADQNLINGPNFMEWMDEFIQHLMGSRLGPYIGNLGAPVLANPAFLQVCNKYFALRNSKFLNWYAFVRDNRPWEPLRRISWDQVGDLTQTQRQVSPTVGAPNDAPGSSDLPDDVDVQGLSINQDG